MKSSVLLDVIGPQLPVDHLEINVLRSDARALAIGEVLAVTIWAKRLVATIAKLAS